MSEELGRIGGVFERIETIESWDGDYYHPIAEKFYDLAVERMLRIMQVEADSLVLDAGCGPGRHSVRVARAGYRVCGIDLSEAMLSVAAAYVEEVGVSDRITLRREDLAALSFEDESFDYVFSWGVIIHIRDVEKSLDELCRVVRPGGRLALYVTNHAAWDHKLEAFARSCARKPLRELQRLPMGDGIWYSMHGERLWVWRMDAAALTSYVEARGFRLVRRSIGEMTEIQRRLGGLPRRLLLYLNRLCHRAERGALGAATNLFVFQKSR